MMSFSLVLACTACPLFWVKWMRSTPYLGSGIVIRHDRDQDRKDDQDDQELYREDRDDHKG